MSEIEIYPGYVAKRGVGVIPRADVSLYSGLELLQRIIDGHYPVPPIGLQLGFALTEVSAGRAVFRGVPDERHLNPLGSVHGGWTATIMDSALACSVQTLLEKGEAYTTAEFKVNLIRPITTRTGLVECEGRVVHKGRTTAVSEAKLTDKDGKLLAFGTETCTIFPAANLAPR